MVIGLERADYLNEYKICAHACVYRTNPALPLRNSTWF